MEWIDQLNYEYMCVRSQLAQAVEAKDMQRAEELSLLCLEMRQDIEDCSM